VFKDQEHVNSAIRQNNRDSEMQFFILVLCKVSFRFYGSKSVIRAL